MKCITDSTNIVGIFTKTIGKITEKTYTYTTLLHFAFCTPPTHNICVEDFNLLSTNCKLDSLEAFLRKFNEEELTVYL